MTKAYDDGWNSSINAYVGGPVYSTKFDEIVEWYRGRLDAMRKAGVLHDESKRKMQIYLGKRIYAAIYGEQVAS
jgi:hypothetical protein